MKKKLKFMLLGVLLGIMIIELLVFIGMIIFFNSLRYELKFDLPKEVKCDYETPGTEIIEYNGEYYVFVKMGEKTSGGYSIKIKKVEIFMNKANIFVETEVPEPFETVTTVMTAPCDVVKFNKKPIVNVIYVED